MEIVEDLYRNDLEVRNQQLSTPRQLIQSHRLKLKFSIKMDWGRRNLWGCPRNLFQVRFHFVE